MKLKIFESDNLEFRKSVAVSRSDITGASKGDWENQDDINNDFLSLVLKESRDPNNQVYHPNSGPGNRVSIKYIDLNHLASEAYKCTDFSDMFNKIPYPVDVSEWDVSRGRNFNYMFNEAIVYGTLYKWDMSNATDVAYMFRMCEFPVKGFSADDIKAFEEGFKNWDVSNVKNFSGMFAHTQMDPNVSNWDVSNGIDFTAMFNNNVKFNRDLSKWNPEKAIYLDNLLTGALAYDGDMTSDGWKNVLLPSQGPTKRLYAIPIERGQHALSGTKMSDNPYKNPILKFPIK